MPRFKIVQAPSGLGLRSRGVEQLGDALLDAGFAEELAAEDGGRTEPAPHRGTRDPESGVLNLAEIAAFTPRLADALMPVLDGGTFPVVLGGDCSIMLGTLLAVRRRRRAGLLFIDGHADFYQPEAEPAGEVASMELALACGRGPRPLADLEGHGPLVREGDVLAFGLRDADEQAETGSQPLPDAMRVIDLDAVRHEGIDAATERALAHLTRSDAPDGFWIHVDADVLDDAIMPAVDYRLPGGLEWAELSHLLAAAMATGRAVGLELTIFNPTLDPGASIAHRLSVAIAGPLRDPAGHLLAGPRPGDRGAASGPEAS